MSDVDDSSAPASSRALEGKTLGNYRIDKLLGEGAMGEVFRATHVALGRPVALKTLKPAVAADRSLTERFFAEARAVNIIRHENIVECTDLVNDPAGHSYIVMELLEGRTVGAAIEAVGRIPLQRAARIGAQIADAIAAAHDKGIVHRDLKPENVYLIKRAGSSDYVKVLDFGIARLRPEHGAAMATQTGVIIGTPAYMAPEQVRGEKVGPAADIYALGVLMFHMLAGRLPFEAASMSMMLVAQLQETPPLLDTLASDIPPAMAGLIARLLAKQAADRPPDMTTVRRQLLEAAGLPADLPEAPETSSRGMAAAVAATLPPTIAPPHARVGASSISGGAGELAGARPRSRSRLFAVGGVVAAGGLVALFAIRPWSGGSERAEPVAAAPPPAVAVQPPAVPPVVAPSVVAPQETKPPEATPPEPKVPDGKPLAARPPATPVDAPTRTAASDPASLRYTRLLAKAAELSHAGAMCDQIKQVYIEALGVKPSGIEAIVAIGKCELELHDFDEALFRFRAALKLAPRNEAALAGIAEAFTGMGKKDRAVTAWNDYLDVFPRSTKAINRLDRLAATPVVKPEPTPPAEPAKPEEAVKPAGPTAVPPAALEANRIAGTKEILPDEATETEIERSGKTRLVASLKLCVSDTGAIQSVTLLKPTGFAAYDAKLQDQIKTWRYRPFLVDGKPAAVCTAVTFVYSQR